MIWHYMGMILYYPIVIASYHIIWVIWRDSEYHGNIMAISVYLATEIVQSLYFLTRMGISCDYDYNQLIRSNHLIYTYVYVYVCVYI